MKITIQYTKKNSIFFPFILFFFSYMLFAQTNYTSGNILDCKTWSAAGDKDVVLNNMNILAGTTITVNNPVNCNSSVFNSGSILTVPVGIIVTLGSSYSFTCYSGTITPPPSTYNYNTSCFFDNLVDRPLIGNILYLNTPGLPAGRYTAYISVSFFNDKTCWTTDWNLWAYIYQMGSRPGWIAVHQIDDRERGFNIWNDRYTIQTGAAAQECGTIGSNAEVYTNTTDFGGYVFTLESGDSFKIQVELSNGNASCFTTWNKYPRYLRINSLVITKVG